MDVFEFLYTLYTTQKIVKRGLLCKNLSSRYNKYEAIYWHNSLVEKNMGRAKNVLED